MQATRRMMMFFESADLRIGLFTCSQPDPAWIRVDRVTTGHLLVFPWTSGIITHRGAEPVVADSTRIMLYNLGEEYTRSPVQGGGEQSAVFAFAPATILEAASRHEPAVQDRPSRPLSFAHAPSNRSSMLAHRALFEEARRPEPDGLLLHEQSLWLLRVVLDAAYATRGQGTVPARSRRDDRHARECAEQVRAVLAARYAEPLTLHDIAAAVHLSPFHLARLFRQQAGTSIHQHRNRLRLNAALHALGERGICLAGLALDVGYRHQSHLTNHFTRHFGIPPGRARHLIRDRGATEVSRILQERPSV